MFTIHVRTFSNVRALLTVYLQLSESNLGPISKVDFYFILTLKPCCYTVVNTNSCSSLFVYPVTQRIRVHLVVHYRPSVFMLLIILYICGVAATLYLVNPQHQSSHYSAAYAIVLTCNNRPVLLRLRGSQIPCTVVHLILHTRTVLLNK